MHIHLKKRSKNKCSCKRRNENETDRTESRVEGQRFRKGLGRVLNQIDLKTKNKKLQHFIEQIISHFLIVIT